MPGNIINLTPEDVAKWPTPNYTDPHRRRWMPAYAGVLYGVATVMGATRLWLRAKQRGGGLGIDDVLLICAWLTLSCFTALSIAGSERFDTSRHMWDIPLTMYENTALITWIAELDFLVCGCFLKCSVLLFYRRLARNAVSPLWIWGVQFAIAFTVAYSLAFVLTLIFNCSPTEAYWKSFSLTYTTDYTCVNTTAINLLAGILSIISDLYSIILPCMMTRHLLLPPTQRLALYIIFSLGLLAVAASSVRTYWLYQVGHSSDVSTCIFYVFVWAQLELSLGMMCTALPSLRVVFREYLSEPLSKLKRSVNTTSRSHRLSDAEEMIIAHTGAIPDLEQCHRVHDTPKHTPKSSVTTTTSSFTYDDISSIEPVVDDSTRPASWTKDIPYLVRTPADYESYNLHNMEKYRQSVHARDFSRSTTERSSRSGRIEEKEKQPL